ncbi:MAG: AMP-binding protein [Candidatus Aquirickettsiella sp.]
MVVKKRKRLDIIAVIAVVLGKMVYLDEQISFEVYFFKKKNNFIDKKCHIIVKKQWLDKSFSDFEETIYKQLNGILQLPKYIRYPYKITSSPEFEIGVYLLDENVSNNLIFSHALNIVVNHDNTISIVAINIEDKFLIASMIEGIHEVLKYLENEGKQIKQTSVNKINIIPRKMYNKMIRDWNDTDTIYPKNKTLYELFQKQVSRMPNEIAVVFGNQYLTYKELNEKSNQLARYIRTKYLAHTKELFSADTLIPLFLDRNLDVFISILAVLKAGGAYVPIDPDYPIERIKCIFENTDCKLLLTHSHFLEYLKNFCLSRKTRPLLIAVNDTTYQQEDRVNLLSYSKPDNLAYVVYSSGTTGLPKGIAISHGNFIGKCFDTIKDRNIGESTLICINYVFDPFVRLMFVPLLSGGKIILSEPTLNLDISSIIGILKNQQIDSLCLVPSILQVFLDYIEDFNMVMPNKVRCLYSVGERLERKVFVKNFESVGASSFKSIWA